MLDKALKIADVAQRLGVSGETVRRWITSKQLRGVLVSLNRQSQKPRYVVLPEDLAAFERRRTTGEPARQVRRSQYRRSQDYIRFFKET